MEFCCTYHNFKPTIRSNDLSNELINVPIIKNFIVRYTNQPSLIKIINQKLYELMELILKKTNKNLKTRVVFTKNKNISEFVCHSDITKWI